jgi:hypothetical protein
MIMRKCQRGGNYHAMEEILSIARSYEENPELTEKLNKLLEQLEVSK